MESKHCIAIYNIAPVLKGHSLVLPKRHITSLMDFTVEELADFSLFSREVTKVLKSAFIGKSFDWSLQEGAEAGQSVDHVHLHIIVRKPNDLLSDENWYKKIKENDDTLLDSIHRHKLSNEEHLFYTDFIRQEIIRLEGQLLKKEE
jgi:bis(5'-adenosyl)-triphosphatase